MHAIHEIVCCVVVYVHVRMRVRVCVCAYYVLCGDVLKLLCPFLTCEWSLISSTDSGNGTGSTNSSRPQSQIITDPHGTPSNSESPQIRPSSDKPAVKEDVQSMDKVPEKKCEEPPTVKVETSRTNVLHNSVDLPASSSGAKSTSTVAAVITKDTVGSTSKDNTSDTTKETTNDTLKDTNSDTAKATTSETTKDNTSDTTEDTTSNKTKGTSSDTTKDTTSDATKDTTSDTTKDTTSDKTQDVISDTTRDTVSNLESVQPEDAKDVSLDSISDITDSTVTSKAWLDNIKPSTITITNADKQSGSEESPNGDKDKVDKLDIKRNFDETDNDDVFVELPTRLRKSQFPPGSPISPNMSPRLSVGGSSPINMSPRPGRRSSFVSRPSCIHPCRTYTVHWV